MAGSSLQAGTHHVLSSSLLLPLAQPPPHSEFLAEAEAEGATLVNGTFVDRLAPGGYLAAVAPAPSMAEQFPLRCRVVGNLYFAPTIKATAFKVGACLGAGALLPESAV